jgi:1,4-alpha-glucan branching enzyme
MAKKTEQQKKETKKSVSKVSSDATAKSTKAAAIKKAAVKTTKDAETKKTTAVKKAPAVKKSPAAKKSSSGTGRKSAPVAAAAPLANVMPYSLFSEFDVALFRSGKHFRLYRHFGAHAAEVGGISGTYFAVWAPNAQSVSVIGNFNHWNAAQHPLMVRWDSSGIWEGFLPGVSHGEVYKYAIRTAHGEVLEKADPFGFFWEHRPNTGTISWQLDYQWKDRKWMDTRSAKNSLQAPFSVYEVHLASWRRDPSNPERFLSYREIAEALVPYVKDMGFTHVEFMPVMEHPFDGSWGYQVTGYFAPSSRFGCPQDFMSLVDELHQAGIGVILDWVPAHFPGDQHALYKFDGTHLYEHEDMRKGYHPDWKSYIFNLGRNEVRSFMMSSALFWMDLYHADGLRVDAVASMLYLDYSRNAGEWIPNEHGGRENLESVSFFREMNETIYSEYPGTQTIAEESTSWPGVSRPTYTGGLGFGMKWMMGWMNDSLRYFERDPYYRQYHQNEITFSLVYAFTENFMLPLSHDEVVHGKKSLVYKMPGDDWQRFANLRLLYMWMFTHPGAKLLFQGCEFAQTAEWNHERSLDWHLLDFAPHQGVQSLIRQLNKLYVTQPALHEKSFEAYGFEWIDNSDHSNSVLVFMRKCDRTDEHLIVVLNLTPVIRKDYRIGLPAAGEYHELINSDHAIFGGSGTTNTTVHTEDIPWQHRQYSAAVDLPPLGGFMLKRRNPRSGRGL